MIVLDTHARLWWVSQPAKLAAAARELTTAIALRAAGLDRDRFPGDQADRIIYATAVAHDAQLVTRDELIREFDGHRTVWN